MNDDLEVIDKRANGEQRQTIKAPTTIDLRREIAELRAELTARGEQLDQVRWCFAELVFGLKVAAAQQAMKDPAVQERMLRQMIAEMDGAVAPTSNSQGAQ